MNHGIVRTMCITAATLLLTQAMATAQWRGTGGGGDTRHWGTDRTTATAALQPVGGADGWGRITVMDLSDNRNDTVDRVLTVHLYGLAPAASYGITIDGVAVADVVTDAAGDTWVRLDTVDGDTPAPPAQLAPAARLMLAQVVDASLAPTLEGEFAIVTHGGTGFGGLSYVERVALEPVGGAPVRGIARVSRTAGDVQAFESRACGLEPGAAYHLIVDGALAGVVAADEVGQGWLVLTTEPELDPLPSALQPIEELRMVEWTTAAGEVILTGSFSGFSMAGFGGGRHGGAHGGSHGGGHGGGSGGGNGGGNGRP